MKKIVSILIMAVAALIAVPQASAYSEEMAEFAKLLNENTQDGSSATYDGKDIIISFPASFFGEEEAAIFGTMEDLQPFAPVMVQVLNESMGAENVQLFGSLLGMYDTNLVIKLDLNGVTRKITLTPSLLMGGQ